MLELNKIYNEDCITGMKKIDDESIDIIIADPPYGIDYQSSRRIDKTKRHKKILNDKRPFVWFLYDAYRTLKSNGCILCFCRWDTEYAFKEAMEWAGFTVKSQVIWNREIHGMGDLKSQFAPMHDIIWFATKGDYKFPNKRPKSIINSQRISGNNLIHPNEKPVDLIEQLLNAVSKENDIVLDPFMGSGTTAIACINTNRNFIGFEIDKKYYDIANKRIQEYLQKTNQI